MNTFESISPEVMDFLILYCQTEKRLETAEERKQLFDEIMEILTQKEVVA